MKRNSKRGAIIPVIFATFVGGVAAGWWAHARFDRAGAPSPVIDLPTTIAADPNPPTAVNKETPRSVPTISDPDSPVERVKERRLQVPIDDTNIGAMRGQFGDRRGGGSRGHEAVDIMAPRSTPIHAADDGTIVKLFSSRQGGTTIYEFDPTERFCYYYAHLESYAPGLHEGQRVSRGEVIGFVGTTGNAPPNAPHLHFAIVQLNADHRWWEGTPIDPFPVFSR